MRKSRCHAAPHQPLLTSCVSHVTDKHFRARIALLIQPPPNSQKVSNVVMGARSYGHRNENKFNTERLLILLAKVK